MLLMVLVSVGTTGCKKDKSPEPSCTGHLTVEDFVVRMDEEPLQNQILGKIPFTACNGTVTFSETALPFDINNDNELIAKLGAHHHFNHEVNGPFTNNSHNINITYTGTDTTFTKTIKVSFVLNDIDDIERYLTTSQDAYQKGSTGNWIPVTASEYEVIANSIYGVDRLGLIGKYPNPVPHTFHNMWSLHDSKETLMRNKSSVQVRGFKHLIAVKFVSLTTGDNKGREIRMSFDSNQDKGHFKVGNVLPNHGRGASHFVLKGCSEQLSNNTSGYGILSLFSGDGSVAVLGDTDLHSSVRVGVKGIKTRTEKHYQDDYLLLLQGLASDHDLF